MPSMFLYKIYLFVCLFVYTIGKSMFWDNPEENPYKFPLRFILIQQPLGIAAQPVIYHLSVVSCSSYFSISPIRILINSFNNHLLNT